MANSSKMLSCSMRPRKIYSLSQDIDNSRVVGNTNGLGFFSNLHDRSLYISDYINPLASKSKPSKVIPLPPLTSLYPCPTEVFCNVAMSASPFDDDDSKEEACVVAVNFLGRQLSVCETRPNRDWRWTNVVTPFTFLGRSNLMYSKRDQRFYLPAPGSTYLCSWDLHFKKDDNPSLHKFLYRNRPNLSQSEHELLDFCSREEHWVESAAGERFLVRCYTHDSQHQERDPVIMVFSEEEITEKGGIMSYTEDIGDQDRAMVGHYMLDGRIQ